MKRPAQNALYVKRNVGGRTILPGAAALCGGSYYPSTIATVANISLQISAISGDLSATDAAQLRDLAYACDTVIECKRMQEIAIEAGDVEGWQRTATMAAKAIATKRMILRDLRVTRVAGGTATHESAKARKARERSGRPEGAARARGKAKGNVIPFTIPTDGVM